MMHEPQSRRYRAFTAIAAALVIALSAATADARAGKGGSSGSRGSRTNDAPAATTTAPNSAAPMERSAAPQTQPGFNQNRPGATAPASGGFFSRGGFGGMLVGGLIGAGIAGLLFGGGFFDGLGTFAGILGFLLQVLLVVFLVRLAFRFFQNRNKPAFAGATPRQGMNPGGPIGGGPIGAGMMGGAAAGAARPSGVRRTASDELGVQPADFNEFERLLGAVQTAYGTEDIGTLRSLATPEMASYFADDLEDNARRGVINRVSDARLLQGDLAEGWREGAAEFATVAMRFSLIDVTVDRATNRVVEGDPDTPVEVREVWTFRRPTGGRWQLSAIQQA